MSWAQDAPTGVNSFSFPLLPLQPSSQILPIGWRAQHGCLSFPGLIQKWSDAQCLSVVSSETGQSLCLWVWAGLSKPSWVRKRGFWDIAVGLPNGQEPVWACPLLTAFDKHHAGLAFRCCTVGALVCIKATWCSRKSMDKMSMAGLSHSAIRS